MSRYPPAPRSRRRRKICDKLYHPYGVLEKMCDWGAINISPPTGFWKAAANNPPPAAGGAKKICYELYHPYGVWKKCAIGEL